MPVAAKFFAPIPTNPEVHLTSCTIGTEALSWEVQQPGYGMDHPLHPVLKLQKE
jgi:hypothetical protein